MIERIKGERMPECKKCGYKVEEEMSFCPKCGAPLKAEAVSAEQPSTTAAHYRVEKEEKHEKREKGEKREKEEKHEKGEYSFIGPLVGGIVLIIIGLMSYLQITGVIDRVAREILWAFFIIIIGILLIFGAIYAMTTARRRNP